MTITVTISVFGIVASIMDLPARQSPEYNLAAPTVRVARSELLFQDTQGFSRGKTESNP
jgi:hypothetical protein